MAVTKDETTYVYRAYGTHGLVYVGISRSYATRISQMHGKNAPWSNLDSHWIVSEYPTREEALQAEAWAIHRECAIFNLDRTRQPTSLPRPVSTFGYTPNRGKRAKKLTAKTQGLVDQYGWDWVRNQTNPTSWYEPLYEETEGGYGLVQD